VATHLLPELAAHLIATLAHLQADDFAGHCEILLRTNGAFHVWACRDAGCVRCAGLGVALATGANRFSTTVNLVYVNYVCNANAAVLSNEDLQRFTVITGSWRGRHETATTTTCAQATLLRSICCRDEQIKVFHCR
jgi:hypothetical protein